MLTAGMRTAGFAAALILAASVTAASADPAEVEAVPPASVAVQLWCWQFPGRHCEYRAGEAAWSYCGGNRRPRFVRSALMQRSYRRGQKAFYLFDCR